MTVIISDTGPINYLVLIQEIDVLPRLFDEVIMPEAVLAELQHDRTPVEVMQWTQSLPSWVTVERPTVEPVVATIPESLGNGEVAAITVALRRQVPILMDDREARQIAGNLGLTTLGTLAILEAAAKRRWLDFRTAAESLRSHGFYLTDILIEEIAERAKR